MKKCILIIGAVLCLFAQNQAEAKAFKLGRDTPTISATQGKVTPRPTTDNCSTNCVKCLNKRCLSCKSGYLLQNFHCKPCPANGTCTGTGTFSCKEGYRKVKTECVSNCTGVRCVSGATAVVQNNGCCCKKTQSPSCPTNCIKCTDQGVCTQCSSKYRLSSGVCVANCTGVSCIANATSYATDTGCCCKAALTGKSCGNFEVYNEVIGKCVNAVCPNHCADMCSKGYCSTCSSGYYLDYTSGMCPSCSSAIANCSQCTSSKTGVVCQRCTNGEKPVGGQCRGTSSSHGPCVNGTPTYCGPGFILEKNGCCPIKNNNGAACFQCVKDDVIDRL